MPLNACEKLMRISAYFGGPQTGNQVSYCKSHEILDVKLTGYVWISSCLQRAEAIANDEDTGAEATKTVSLDSGNGTECPNTCNPSRQKVL